MKRIDIFLLVLLVLLITTIFLFLFYARSEGAKCLSAPTKYEIEKAGIKDLICSCSAEGKSFIIGDKGIQNLTPFSFVPVPVSP